MAVSDVTNPSSDAEKTLKEIPKSKDKKEKPLTKVVVRRLPPSIDQETFLMQVSPIPDYDYIYLVNGDASLGENAFSRVYINFIQASDIFMFKEKFDNYVFVDQRGHEYPAVVEFASFQKIPRKRKPRLDPKSGTIETDPIYLEFVESLKEQPNQDIKPEFSYQFNNDPKDDVSSTPLLDYIKQRRIDKQRIREERREERKRKELERKKVREDERKKHEFKTSPRVTKSSPSSRSSKTSLDSVREEADKSAAKVKEGEEKETVQSEKSPSASTSKDEEKTYFKPKPRFPRPEKIDYSDKRSDYKRRDEYREKEFRNRRFEEYKKDPDPKSTPRRTKKYSEKREERRNEAKKAEQKMVEESIAKVESSIDDDGKNKADVEEKLKVSNVEMKTDATEKKFEGDEDVSALKDDRDNKYKNKENDPRLQRRIRNKDRPTMAIYQPGMLSKRRPSDEEPLSVTKE